MSITIDRLGTDTIFATREAAQTLVDVLSLGDNWEYLVEPCVGGFTVAVYDGDTFLGNL